MRETLESTLYVLLWLFIYICLVLTIIFIMKPYYIIATILSPILLIISYVIVIKIME